ncbi:MAG: mercury resistance system periplasmic binding protein MerP [Glaciecola sp.]|jgi:mercuric ion binding protein
MKKFLIIPLLLLISATTFAKDVTVTLEVPTMDCVTCPITVEKALERVKGVKLVEVTLENKLAVVTFDDELTTLDALTKATANAGYPSQIKS